MCIMYLYTELLLLIFVTSAAPGTAGGKVPELKTKEDWTTAIEEAFLEHTKVYNAQNIQGLVDGYTQDPHRFPPVGPAELGIDAVKKGYKDELDAGVWLPQVIMTLTDLRVFCGDRAVAEFKLVSTSKDGDVTHSKGMVLMVSGNDGLKIASFISNKDENNTSA